jgi:TPR repeat protein
MDTAIKNSLLARAEKGDLHAAAELGFFFHLCATSCREAGDREQLFKLALAWFRTASKSETNGAAYNAIGYMHAHGEGCEKNLAVARQVSGQEH